MAGEVTLAMPAFCSACKAELLWAVTPAGERMPVDQLPDRERGNVLLLRPTALGENLAVTLSGEALKLARRRQADLRLEHHATCPDAKLFT